MIIYQSNHKIIKHRQLFYNDFLYTKYAVVTDLYLSDPANNYTKLPVSHIYAFTITSPFFNKIHFVV